MDPTPVAYGKWLPPLISQQAAGIDSIIFYVHILMVVLFVGWGAFFVYCLVNFRHRDGHKAQYEPVKGTASKYVEVSVLAAELVLLFALSMPIWAAYRNVPEKFDKPAVEITVTGQQFKWAAHYAGPDGKMGKMDLKYMDDASNPLGLDPNDPDGKDDIVPPSKVPLSVLTLPADQPIVIHLRSKDVIHSFFFPVARIKQDAIPGMDTPIWFELNKDRVAFTETFKISETEKVPAGKYEIACAQLCGKGHASMNAVVNVLSPEDFQKWIQAASNPPKEEEFSEEETK